VSYHITQFVLALTGLTPAEKSVLHSLAYHADKDGGNAYPSMTTIALEAGLSCRQTAQRIVWRMEKKGVIFAESNKRGGRRVTTRYRFNLEYCNPGESATLDVAVSETATPEVAVSAEESATLNPESATLGVARKVLKGPKKRCDTPTASAQRAFREFQTVLPTDQEAFNLVRWILYRAAHPGDGKPGQVPQDWNYYKTAWRNFDAQREYGTENLLDVAGERFDKYARPFLLEKAPGLLEWIDEKQWELCPEEVPF